MNGAVIFRMTCLTALWLLLVWIVVTSQPFSLRVAFIVVASGIVVFVPVYKKYLRNKNNDGKGRNKH